MNFWWNFLSHLSLCFLKMCSSCFSLCAPVHSCLLMKLTHVHSSFSFQNTDILTGRMMMLIGWARAFLSNLFSSRHLTVTILVGSSSWGDGSLVKLVACKHEDLSSHLQNAFKCQSVMTSLPAIWVSENRDQGWSQNKLSRWAILVSSGFDRETLPPWIKWKNDQGSSRHQSHTSKYTCTLHTQVCVYTHASMHVPHPEAHTHRPFIHSCVLTHMQTFM